MYLEEQFRSQGHGRHPVDYKFAKLGAQYYGRRPGAIGASAVLLDAHTDLVAGFAMQLNADKNVSATCDALGQFNDNLRERVKAGNLAGEFNHEWINHEKRIFGLSGEG